MAQAASGDIIYVKHRGYQHFGIYAGDGRVIRLAAERIRTGYNQRRRLLCLRNLC